MADTHRLKSEFPIGGRGTQRRTLEKTFRFISIGVTHSSFKEPSDIPREFNVRRNGFRAIRGTLEIYPAYARGLRDIDGFSHIQVIFFFHKASGPKLLVRPPAETRLQGVFSSRSPHRPNAIGLSILRLESRKGRRLFVSGLDLIEGTPILDIKPYTARDRKSGIKTGWISGRP